MTTYDMTVCVYGLMDGFSMTDRTDCGRWWMVVVVGVAVWVPK